MKISFAKRQFFLGRYNDFETAVAVIKAAEELRREVLEEIDVLQDSALNVFSQRMDGLMESSLCQEGLK